MLLNSIIANMSLVLFFIGLWGLLVIRRTLIVMLMSIEIMLLALSTMFVNASSILDDITGQLVALFILTVAAAESAMGLAIMISYYRLTGSIELNSITTLKG